MAAVRARSSGPCIRTDSLSLGSHRAMLVTSSQTERGQSSPAIQIFEIASPSSAIHSRSIPGLIGHLPPPSTFFLRISIPPSRVFVNILNRYQLFHFERDTSSLANDELTNWNFFLRVRGNFNLFVLSFLSRPIIVHDPSIESELASPPPLRRF